MYHRSPRKMNAEAFELSERLRKCRYALGERQIDFARRLGISMSTYSRYERYGPPNTVPHRGYVRLMLEKISNGALRARKRFNERRAKRLEAAGLSPQAIADRLAQKRRSPPPISRGPLRVPRWYSDEELQSER